MYKYTGMILFLRLSLKGLKNKTKNQTKPNQNPCYFANVVKSHAFLCLVNN